MSRNLIWQKNANRLATSYCGMTVRWLRNQPALRIVDALVDKALEVGTKLASDLTRPKPAGRAGFDTSVSMKLEARSL